TTIPIPTPNKKGHSKRPPDIPPNLTSGISTPSRPHNPSANSPSQVAIPQPRNVPTQSSPFAPFQDHQTNRQYFRLVGALKTQGLSLQQIIPRVFSHISMTRCHVSH